MRDRLDKMMREISAWNMKALNFKSNILSIICAKLNKILNIIDNNSQNVTNELRTLFKEVYMLLDKFILQDMSNIVKCVKSCGCNPSGIFGNYIFRDELYYIKNICEKLNIQYDSSVIKLEIKYNQMQELPF